MLSLNGVFCDFIAHLTLMRKVLMTRNSSQTTRRSPLGRVDGRAKISRLFNFARIFNHSRNYLQKFLTHEPQFSRSDCKRFDGQHPQTMLPNLRGTLSKSDTFEVGKRTTVRQCVILGLNATPIVHY